jgi:hypothetical protein
VTPAPEAECPKENPDLVPDLSDPNLYHFNEILTYLNSGGTLDRLATSFSARNPNFDWGKIMALTGDGVREMVYRE